MNESFFVNVNYAKLISSYFRFWNNFKICTDNIEINDSYKRFNDIRLLVYSAIVGNRSKHSFHLIIM